MIKEYEQTYYLEIPTRNPFRKPAIKLVYYTLNDMKEYLKRNATNANIKAYDANYGEISIDSFTEMTLEERKNYKKEHSGPRDKAPMSQAVMNFLRTQPTGSIHKLVKKQRSEWRKQRQH